MPPKKTVEQTQIEEAPIVTGSETPTESETPTTPSAHDVLETTVRDLLTKQFGGTDDEGEADGSPQEGVEAWDPMVREQVLAADNLEVEYRQVLAKKEANRTLLRAFSDMGNVPAEIAAFYYPPRQRRGSRDAA